MPLIDDHEFKQQDDGLRNVIKIVLAVSFDEELWAVEFGVSTEDLLCRQVAMTMECDQATKELHTDDGVDIEDHLEICPKYISMG